MVLGQAWSSYSESYKANGATFDFVIFVVGIVRENQPEPSIDCFGYTRVQLAPMCSFTRNRQLGCGSFIVEPGACLAVVCRSRSSHWRRHLRQIYLCFMRCTQSIHRCDAAMDFP